MIDGEINRKVIYKYQLEITDTQTISMPPGAEILCVQSQSYELCIWALCTPDDHLVELRRFRVAGTGRVFNEKVKKYIGTVQMAPFVWHVLEIE